MIMLEFGNSSFYIDLKALAKATEVQLEKQEETEMRSISDKAGNENVEKVERTFTPLSGAPNVKSEIVFTFLDFILDYESDMDDTIGAKRALNNTSFAYKLAFNTLLKEGIIKEK